MKNINGLNLFIMLIPISFGLLSFLDEEFLFYAALSILPLGLFQIILAIYLSFEKPKINYLNKYWALVILFFTIWIFSSSLSKLLINKNYIYYTLYWTPPTLSIYFSLLIFNASKTTTK